MEFLAMLYTVLLVAICLMLALLLYRGNKPRRGGRATACLLYTSDAADEL